MDLEDGACSVDVKAFDNAGNENSATVSFIVDTVAPSINVTSPDDGAWLNATCMNVTWTGSDGGSGIAYYLVNLNGTQVANTTSEYLVLTDLKAGWYNVSVRAYDNAGNMNESYKLFSIELSSPSLNIVDPIENELFASTSVDASWSSNPPSGVLHYWVSVDGGQWVQETGTEITMSDLAQGTNVLSVKVVDAAGNWNETSVSFVVDTTAPSITILTPTGGSYNNTGTGRPIVERFRCDLGVAYYEVEVYNGAWTIYTDISVTDLLLDLEDGACSVDVKAFDNAGNENSATVSFIVDTIAPSINVTSPDDGAWFNTTSMNVTWTGSDGGSGIAYYLVFLNGTQVANTTSDYLVLTD